MDELFDCPGCGQPRLSALGSDWLCPDCQTPYTPDEQDDGSDPIETIDGIPLYVKENADYPEALYANGHQWQRPA